MLGLYGSLVNSTMPPIDLLRKDDSSPQFPHKSGQNNNKIHNIGKAIIQLNDIILEHIRVFWKIPVQHQNMEDWMISSELWIKLLICHITNFSLNMLLGICMPHLQILSHPSLYILGGIPITIDKSQ